MTMETALTEIKKFWKGKEPFPFGLSDNTQHLERLKTEFNFSIPHVVEDYAKNYAPIVDFWFDTVGNPMCIYGVENLKHSQGGYNYNTVKKETISDWPDSYFLFADEGADPVIIDLTKPKDGIQRLMHGAGNWNYGEILADTFGQFLLCCAAQHHAINNFEQDPFIDDNNGFNLADNAAKWYFKNMKVWAGNYYEVWCYDFDNR